MFLSTSEYEGYGMSLVEAGLCRLPIVSTDVGLSGELLVHLKNAYVCPVGDVDCFYEGVKKMIGDNGLRLILSETLFEDINSRMISKEEYVKRYVALLKETAHDNLQK